MVTQVHFRPPVVHKPSMGITDLKVRETTQVCLKRRHLLSVRVYLSLFSFLAFRAVGNLSLAWGVRHLSKALTINPVAYLQAIFNPVVAIGILFFVGAIVARLVLLSVADLSFVVPMTGIGYVVSVVTGRLFLHETVSLERWLGVGLIFAAVLLVGSTPKRSGKTKLKAATDGPVPAAR